MSKKITVAIGAGAYSFFAGLFLASSGFKGSFVKTFALSGLLSLPTIFVAHLIIDGRATGKVNKAERRANDATKALDRAKTQLSEIEGKNAQLASRLTQVQQALRSTQTDRDRALAVGVNLQQTVTDLENQLAESSERIGYLEELVNQWELHFNNHVEAEAEKRLKEAKSKEIQAIFDEHDAITSEAMQLFRQLQSWGEKVAHGHESKRQIIQSLAVSYNSNLDDLSASVDKERQAYLQQIELLQEKVGRLQHELAGDLLEPVYGEFGFSPDGKVANSLANWLWLNRGIPLKVTGFEVGTDGTVTAGYSYGRSVLPESLIAALERDSSEITRNLGLYAIESARKLQITDCLAVKIRKERPAKKADKGSLYRSKEDFIKYILSQPIRIRVIGEPGSGKTPTVVILIAHLLDRGFLSANTPNGQKLPHCIVESCNPQQ